MSAPLSEVPGETTPQAKLQTHRELLWRSVEKHSHGPVTCFIGIEQIFMETVDVSVTVRDAAGKFHHSLLTITVCETCHDFPKNNAQTVLSNLKTLFKVKR